MIEQYLYADWDEPPEEMSFVKRFEGLISELRRSLELVLLSLEEGTADYPSSFYEDIKKVYLLAPALPNVALNYKICVDFGLPIDPIKYIDFNRKDKNPNRYTPQEKDLAGHIFKKSLFAAKLAYAFSPNSPDVLSRFCTQLPETIKQAEFTNKKDKYTWQASSPQRIKNLAGKINESIGQPDLIVGAAHGSICPGILLSNFLDCELYFIRYSLFKRNDAQPVISEQDKVFLSRHQHGKVILFDEDVAKGKTLKEFTAQLSPLFEKAYSASVIRHYLSPFCPDFVGEVFYDG